MNNLTLLNRAENFANIIYSTVYTNELGAVSDTEQAFTQLKTLFLKNRKDANAVYIIGNGGSAAVASHALTDFVNVCRLRAFTLHDSSLLTCMSNDFGYEVAFERVVATCIRQNDILICISSSGKSVNIHNAAKAAKEKNAQVVTLSGFHADNPLRKLGCMNFWLNSADYGFVEIGHLFLLHNVVDRIGAAEKEKENANENEPYAVINI